MQVVVLERAWQAVVVATALKASNVEQASALRSQDDYRAPDQGDWEALELVREAELARLEAESNLARETAQGKLFATIAAHYGWGTKIRKEPFGFSLPNLNIEFHYERGVLGLEKEEEETCDAPSSFCACLSVSSP